MKLLGYGGWGSFLELFFCYRLKWRKVLEVLRGVRCFRFVWELLFARGRERIEGGVVDIYYWFYCALIVGGALIYLCYWAG